MSASGDFAHGYVNNPVSGLSRSAFVTRFGGIYEHSIWVAEGCYDEGGHATVFGPAELAARLKYQVEHAEPALQLKLLRAHPDLAGKLAISGELTKESTGEQASIGLDQCTPQEFESFKNGNTNYNEMFGFPFILAVRKHASVPGFSRSNILQILQHRLTQSPEAEFRTALDQVHWIAWFRIFDDAD